MTKPLREEGEENEKGKKSFAGKRTSCTDMEVTVALTT